MVADVSTILKRAEGLSVRLVHIDTLADRRFADREFYSAVGDHPRLRDSGLFVAEGRLVVSRLIEQHAGSVRSLLLNAAAHTALRPTCERLADDVTAYICETRDFERLTGFNMHRGCLALASRLAERTLDDIAATARLLVLLEQVANADNVGGILRNAAAFGANGVILSSGCADPLYRKAIRTSMGAALTVPFATVAYTAWPLMQATLRARGFHIVALTPDPLATDLASFATAVVHDRIALLVGAEGFGLSEQSQAAADVRVCISIRSDVDSLNVAVATGIALHRLTTRIV